VQKTPGCTSCQPYFPAITCWYILV